MIRIIILIPLRFPIELYFLSLEPSDEFLQALKRRKLESNQASQNVSSQQRLSDFGFKSLDYQSKTPTSMNSSNSIKMTFFEEFKNKNEDTLGESLANSDIETECEKSSSNGFDSKPKFAEIETISCKIYDMNNSNVSNDKSSTTNQTSPGLDVKILFRP